MKKRVKEPLYKDFPVLIGRRVYETVIKFRTEFIDKEGNVVLIFPVGEKQPYLSQRTIEVDKITYQIIWDE